MKKIISAAVLIALLGLVWFLLTVDQIQRSGERYVQGLESAVTVHRDSLGIPYIYAQTLKDAMHARGFITAQERLFQMELFKHLSTGTMAKFIGEKGLKNDRLVRTIDIIGIANNQETLLADDERDFIQHYVNGINAYINSADNELPIILSAMQHQVTPWTVHDVLSIQLFITWGSSVNWRQELTMLSLIDKFGLQKAQLLAPLSLNPDNPNQLANLALSIDHDFFEDDNKRAYWGSNAWASNSQSSINNGAIVSGDPHLDARNLPGFWYPLAMITPKHRIVGAATPGVPAIGIGRNANIAWTATNGYGDVIDLFVEQQDPHDHNRYLTGGKSHAFEQRIETIQVKDSDAPNGYRHETLKIRHTNNGPIISDHGMSINPNHLLSLRWSIPEHLASRTGNLDLLLATTVADARQALSHSNTPLNYIVADKVGNVLRQSTGMVPIRRQGQGLIPRLSETDSNWQGIIPFAQMPYSLNPAQGWVGSTNHNIVPSDYPYAYSTHFSPSWRYRRLKQLMAEKPLSTADHWSALFDTKNTLAEKHVAMVLKAIEAEPSLQEMYIALKDWNFHDDIELTAPSYFQAFMREYARHTFTDEMDEALLTEYLKHPYFWQERLFALSDTKDNLWFDDTTTPHVTENRDDIIRKAAAAAIAHLKIELGDDSSQWSWGNYHRIVFFHAFVSGESAAKWLGGGEHPSRGSGETLNRAASAFDTPRQTNSLPSMRIVMDLSQDDYVEAHFPGGNSERLFDQFNKTQLTQWLNQSANRRWFSDALIKSNSQQKIKLLPTDSPNSN